MKGNSEIFIWHQGQEQGPFSPQAVGGSIRLGSLSADTPAWTRSNSTWRTVAEVLKEFPDADQCGSGLIADLIIQPATETKKKHRVKPWIFSHGWKIGAALSTGCVFLLLAIAPTSSKINRSAGSLREAEQCVLMARGETVSGTAFIAMDAGVNYVYTNVHVASTKGLTFTDFRGASVRASERGEVVTTQEGASDEQGIDIVRFPLLDPTNLVLTFSERSLIERASEVWTLGDSGGESILKSLKGNIRGVGPAKIEVDCNFIQGNSGGPIVTPEAKVVGIASYMTLNPSIWAKGTEQEIRRIAWIPGRKFHWGQTTSQKLNLERTLVNDCAITSDLLLVISHLNMSPQGFIAPKDFPAEAVNVIAVAAEHPLCLGIEETGRSIKKQAALPVARRLTAHDEYVKFLTNCADYQKSQLYKADQEIKSSFWRNQLNLKMRDCTEILINFQAQVKEYERTVGHSGSLSSQ